MNVSNNTESKKKAFLKRKIEAGDVIRIAGILVFAGLAVWLTVLFSQIFGEITVGEKTGSFLENMLDSAQSLKDYILGNFPQSGFLILLCLQFLQVVITAIPAVITSFAGGMIYGGWGGMLISIIGSFLGTVLTFYLTRLLGRRVLTLFVSEKNIAKMEKLIGAETSDFVLLVLFILPSPKDFFAFFVGLTKMKAWKFFLISVIGRLPGMFAATYLGATVANRNWVLLIGMTVFAAVASFLFVVLNNKLMALLKRIRSKPKTEP